MDIRVKDRLPNFHLDSQICCIYFYLPRTIHMTIAFPPMAIRSMTAKSATHASCCHQAMSRCGCRLFPPPGVEGTVVDHGPPSVTFTSNRVVRLKGGSEVICNVQSNKVR